MNGLTAVGVEVPIRQGDVFHLRDGVITPYSASEAVALTADCDFANEKHFNQVLLCPIVTIEDYMARFWACSRLKAALSKVLGDARKALANVSSFGATTYSDSAIKDLLADDHAISRLLAEMGGADEARCRPLLRKYGELWRLSKSLEEHPGSPVFEEFVTFQHTREGGELESARRMVFSKFKEEAKKNLPQDVFLLPPIQHQFCAQDVVKLPRVVLLRFPFSIGLDQLTCFPCDFRREHRGGIRVGRLEQVCKHAVSQRFGHQFSRVGLPAAFEKNQLSAIDAWEE